VNAITHSVELLPTLHLDLEKETAAKFAETSQRFSQTLGFVNRLAHAAEAHE
jgi:hypothetical protein